MEDVGCWMLWCAACRAEDEVSRGSGESGLVAAAASAGSSFRTRRRLFLRDGASTMPRPCQPTVTSCSKTCRSLAALAHPIGLGPQPTYREQSVRGSRSSRRARTERRAAAGRRLEHDAVRMLAHPAPSERVQRKPRPSRSGRGKSRVPHHRCPARTARQEDVDVPVVGRSRLVCRTVGPDWRPEPLVGVRAPPSGEVDEIDGVLLAGEELARAGAEGGALCCSRWRDPCARRAQLQAVPRRRGDGDRGGGHSEGAARRGAVWAGLGRGRTAACRRCECCEVGSRGAVVVGEERSERAGGKRSGAVARASRRQGRAKIGIALTGSACPRSCCMTPRWTSGHGTGLAATGCERPSGRARASLAGDGDRPALRVHC